MSTTRKQKPAAGRKAPAKNRKKPAAGKKKKKGGKTAPTAGSLKPALLFLTLAALLVAGLYLFFSLGAKPPAPLRRHAAGGKKSADRAGRPPKSAPTAASPTITIFLPTPDSGRLKPTRVRFNQPLEGTRRARAIIRELSRPRAGIIAPLPAGTRLLGVTFKPPLISLNLSRQLQEGLKNSGAEDEIIAVGSLTNSFLSSFPGYSRLKLQIDGQNQKTLAGHIDISRPLGRLPLDNRAGRGRRPR